MDGEVLIDEAAGAGAAAPQAEQDLSTRLCDAVCDMLGKTTEAREVCKDGLMLMNRLYACGNREPALLIRDWLQGMTRLQLVSAMVLAKAMGLHFALDLLLDVCVTWAEEKTDTLLHHAVMKNNPDMTRALVEIDNAKMKKLEKKGEVALGWINAVNKEGMTPLGMAVIIDYVECLRALIEGDADVNLKCNPTIEFFDRTFERQRILFLVLLGEDMYGGRSDGYTPLEMAVTYNHEACATLLLSASVDLKSTNNSFLKITAMRNREKLTKMILDAGACPEEESSQVTSLHVAAAFAALECMQLLVNAGFNVNAKNKKSATPLHLSVGEFLPLKSQVNGPTGSSNSSGVNTVQTRQTDCVRTLLNAGADVNAVDSELDTPAHRASSYGCASALSLLLTANSNVNALNSSGKTILHSALRTCHIVGVSHQLETMQVAIKAGVNLEQRDCEQRTALHIALEYAMPEHVRLLVKMGANVNVLSSKGESPLVWLARTWHFLNRLPYMPHKVDRVRHCVRILIEAGTDTSHVDSQFLKYVLRGRPDI